MNWSVATERVPPKASRVRVTAPATGLEVEREAEGVSTETVPYSHSVKAVMVPVNVTELAQPSGESPRKQNIERWEGRLQGTVDNKVSRP